MRFGKVHVMVLILVLAMGMVFVSFTRSQAQGTAGGGSATRVAVCNIANVLGDYQRAKDLSNDLKEQRDEIEAENKQRVKKAEELQTQLEGYKSGSPKYDETLQAIQRHEIDRRVWLQMKQQEMLRTHRRLLEDMYNDIHTAVSDVAKEKGFDIVLQSQPGELQQAKDVEQLITQIDRQKVLYNIPGIDITAAVLLRVNEAYQVKK
jgi:Skp family chaperone for outer membrane proteins